MRSFYILNLVVFCFGLRSSKANQAPSITLHPQNVANVTAGSNVRFSCNATGNPAPDIEWRKNGANVSSQFVETSQGNTSVVSYLHIVNVTAKDEGSFVCFANNAAGNATSNAANLTVEVLTATTTASPSNITTTPRSGGGNSAGNSGGSGPGGATTTSPGEGTTTASSEGSGGSNSSGNSGGSGPGGATTTSPGEGTTTASSGGSGGSNSSGNSGGSGPGGATTTSPGEGTTTASSGGSGGSSGGGSNSSGNSGGSDPGGATTTSPGEGTTTASTGGGSGGSGGSSGGATTASSGGSSGGGGSAGASTSSPGGSGGGSSTEVPQPDIEAKVTAHLVGNFTNNLSDETSEAYKKKKKEVNEAVIPVVSKDVKGVRTDKSGVTGPFREGSIIADIVFYVDPKALNLPANITLGSAITNAITTANASNSLGSLSLIGVTATVTYPTNPPTTQPAATVASDNDGGLKGWQVALVVIFVLVLLVIIVFIAFLVFYKKNTMESAKELDEFHDEEEDHQYAEVNENVYDNIVEDNPDVEDDAV